MSRSVEAFLFNLCINDGGSIVSFNEKYFEVKAEEITHEQFMLIEEEMLREHEAETFFTEGKITDFLEEKDEDEGG